MKVTEVKTYTCEYCGLTLVNEEMMAFHEEICPENPQNQPCSKCSRCEINGFTGDAKCSKNMDMEGIGGKVLCFFYQKGQPEIHI